MALVPSPAASFTAAAGTTNRPTTFDAVASNNDGGTINGYRWDLGDGTTETTSSASATHVYSVPATYTVKLTTVNVGGCAAGATPAPATGALRLEAKTLRLRGKSVKVALRCVSSIACRGKLTLTSGKRTCATGSFNLKAGRRAHRKRSARLTSTVTTGQKNITKTVRIKR
jgi:hypothetical protein